MPHSTDSLIALLEAEKTTETWLDYNRGANYGLDRAISIIRNQLVPSESVARLAEKIKRHIAGQAKAVANPNGSFTAFGEWSLDCFALATDIIASMGSVEGNGVPKEEAEADTVSVGIVPHMISTATVNMRGGSADMTSVQDTHSPNIHRSGSCCKTKKEEYDELITSILASNPDLEYVSGIFVRKDAVQDDDQGAFVSPCNPDGSLKRESRSEIPLVSKKHIRDLMLEAAMSIPLDMQYKISAQIDAMLEALYPFLQISKPVSATKLFNNSYAGEALSGDGRGCESTATDAKSPAPPTESSVVDMPWHSDPNKYDTIEWQSMACARGLRESDATPKEVGDALMVVIRRHYPQKPVMRKDQVNE